MTEVLHAGLINDSVPESFSVKHQADDGTVSFYLLVEVFGDAQCWFDIRCSPVNT